MGVLTNPNSKRDVFFENLDGFRFVAYGMVFVFHGFFWFGGVPQSVFGPVINALFTINGNGGFLGVSFFFVLSGFLITYLLLEEKKLNGEINLLYFYARRILRIWPIYFLVLFIGFFIYPVMRTVLGFPVAEEQASFIGFVFFLANFDAVKHQPSPILGVQWSIAVEEQFYLLWPIFLRFFPVRALPFAMFGLVLLSLVFRSGFVGMEDAQKVLEFHSLSVMNDLAIGGLTAWLAHRSSGFIEFFKRLKRRYIVTFYIVGIASLYIGDMISFSGSRLWYSLFFAFVLAEQNFGLHSFFKMHQAKVFSELGKITYGLYLYHMVVITGILLVEQRLGIRGHFVWFPLNILISFSLSILISYVSYRYIEKYFLGLKKKLSFIRRSA